MKKLIFATKKALAEVFKKYKPDGVLHLAAETHVDRSIDSPRQFIETNVIGTYTLLEAAREYWLNSGKNKRNNFRFVHVSTDEVYGDLGQSDVLFSEDTCYAPSSPYSASKASADHLVRAWHRTFKLPILITNCSNNYGPYQYPEKLVPLAIKNATVGIPVPIYGTGQQIRDWLYVDDHVKALVDVLERGTIGETYSISGNNQIKNSDLVTTLCKLLDVLSPNKPKGIESHLLQLIEFVADRAGHDFKYAMDSTKIWANLGWKPVETFESGLEKIVIWHLEQAKSQLLEANK